MAKIKTQNQYYIRLGELMNEMIPEEWTELAVYVEFPKTRPVFKVFFRNGQDSIFSEISDIPEKYVVSKETFDQQYVNLTAFFMDLRRGYEKEYKGRDCKTISLFVVGGEIISEYATPINEKYSYEKRLAIWKYKEIGVIGNADDITALEKHFGSINRGVTQGIKRKPYKDVSTAEELMEAGGFLWKYLRRIRALRFLRFLGF